ncbi:DUF5597 domain-containing protein [Teredinibacter franksiae]|uniref:DUF5597 domain-containing protein n=1 Tax=Teredinibacter franksiae TaxID=2761453 RepID=UPI0028A82DDC|nr:DUF5597 domain-containing protein [Teredinibacter franksiae]
MTSDNFKKYLGFWIGLSILLLGSIAQAALPEFVTENNRHALMVDGKPYLILGAQANNSSNYTAALKEVWPVVKQVHANTLEINVAWEQVEPEEGKFDFSYIDELIKQARDNDVRVVLLWFATWKNNAPHYAPDWVKLDDARFPRVHKKDGSTVNSLSPIHQSTLDADKKAFVEMMKHLKKVDKRQTVILVQVQNEVGTYGEVRDFSPAAEKLFKATIPDQLQQSMNLPAKSWVESFAADADEYFHAYHIARFCNEMAEAGKAVYNLPMNVNVALRNPFNPGKPGQYSSGGPTDNVLDLWKAAAPSIDMISPDIYFRDYRTVTRVLDLYARDDNPLFVAEIGNDQPFARYVFETLGHQGIGFAPFGLDKTGYTNYPLGAKNYDDATFEPFAEVYGLIAPWAHVWAKMSFESETWGVAEPRDTFGESKQIWNAAASEKEKEEESKTYTQVLDLGRWNAEVTYGRPMFWIAPPEGNDIAKGGALIAKLDENEFFVTALHSRVTFVPSDEIENERTMTVRVEEGHFDKKGNWVFERVWNGDQTDWGLNFDGKYHLLKVKMATY